MKTSYRCPTCARTIINMESQFRALDVEIESQPLPVPYAGWRCLISCNDCSAKSNVQFHFLGLKCDNCASYNTSQVRVIRPEEESWGEGSSRSSTGPPQAVPPTALERIRSLPAVIPVLAVNSPPRAASTGHGNVGEEVAVGLLRSTGSQGGGGSGRGSGSRSADSVLQMIAIASGIGDDSEVGRIVDDGWGSDDSSEDFIYEDDDDDDDDAPVQPGSGGCDNGGELGDYSNSDEDNEGEDDDDDEEEEEELINLRGHI